MKYSFYSSVTGLFSPGQVDCPEALAGKFLSSPPGHEIFEGEVDYLRFKMNLVTKVLEEYIPTKPDDTEFIRHIWDEVAWRWNRHPTLLRLQKDSIEKIDEKIAAQEARRVRPNTELLMALADGGSVSDPQHALAVSILRATDEALVALRAARAAIEAATSEEELATIDIP